MLSSLAKTILLNHITIFYENQNNALSLGRPRLFSYDFILDRILFLLCTGCQWAKLPVENGSWKTIYHYFSL